MRRFALKKRAMLLGFLVGFGLVSAITFATFVAIQRSQVADSGEQRERGDAVAAQPTVVDGDTVRWGGKIVRLVGFDTPETGNRARCAAERAKGDAATARLRELIANGVVTVELVRCACRPGTEGTKACNFGRSCGVLRVVGRDAGLILVAEGLARTYRCERFSCPPRGSWC